MYKDLAKETLKKEFFENKDNVIESYINNNYEKGVIQQFTYTNGSVVIVDTDNGKAYTKNGFFFSVILEDNTYVQNLYKEDYLKLLGKEISQKKEFRFIATKKDDNKKIEGKWLNADKYNIESVKEVLEIIEQLNCEWEIEYR